MAGGLVFLSMSGLRLVVDFTHGLQLFEAPFVAVNIALTMAHAEFS
jgi:hypothetical protein